MVGRCMPNSRQRGCPGICFMTIFGSYVGAHFLIFNILMYVGAYEGIQSYLEVYDGIWTYMEVYERI